MFKALWNFLFYACEHKWNTIKEVEVYTSEHRDMPIGRDYIVRCVKCGKIKRFKT